MSAQPPSLTPLQAMFAETAQWQSFVKTALQYLRCAAPAIIQSFDADTQTATVQIAITEIVRQVTTAPLNVPIQPIQRVPIVGLRSGGWNILTPVQAGDECLLIFADSCIDAWWQSGGVQNQIEQRRHDLSDCFAILGPWSQPRLVTTYPDDGLLIQNDAGTVSIKLDNSGNITLASTGNVVIQGKDFLTHTHSGVTTGGADTGPVA